MQRVLKYKDSNESSQQEHQQTKYSEVVLDRPSGSGYCGREKDCILQHSLTLGKNQLLRQQNILLFKIPEKENSIHHTTRNKDKALH